MVPGNLFVKEIEYLKEEKRKSLFLKNCRVILSDLVDIVDVQFPGFGLFIL
jgi:hypothetical protein